MKINWKLRVGGIVSYCAKLITTILNLVKQTKIISLYFEKDTIMQQYYSLFTFFYKLYYRFLYFFSAHNCCLAIYGNICVCVSQRLVIKLNYLSKVCIIKSRRERFRALQQPLTILPRYIFFLSKQIILYMVSLTLKQQQINFW